VETNFAPPGAPIAIEEPLHAYNDRDYLSFAESLEARYTGLTNWVLYVRGEWTQETGNIYQNHVDLETGVGAPADLDVDRFTQKYSVGANWYPLRRLSVGGQYYRKMRDLSYENQLAGVLTNYPGFIQDQDFTTDDVNFRVTVRPWVNLTCVSRYDFQLSTIDMLGDALAEVRSGETRSHIFSESISWSPWARLFMQGSINYVLDETETPANFLGGAARDIVLEAENDYWNVSLLVGFGLNDRTDLQAQYFYYRADNYRNNALFGQPYNAGAEEQAVTLTLIRQLSQALRWTLKYGFFTSHDQTYGSNTDYNTHLVYSALQYRF
jgi:hypothetical protein